MQLHGVLAGIAVRGAAVDRHRLIDHATATVPQRSEQQLSVRRLRQRRAAIQPKDPICDRCAARAGQSYNSDGTGHLPRGNGSNHIRHRSALPSMIFSALPDRVWGTNLSARTGITDSVIARSAAT